MKAVSSAEFETSNAGGLPALELVADDTWVYALPMPPGHMPYTLSYVIRDARGGLHLIDSGWDTDENWTLLNAALAAIGQGIGDVKTVTGTHLHPDHVGLAPRIRAESGALVAMHEQEREGIARRVGWDFEAWGIPESAMPELERAAVGSRTMTSTGFDFDVELHDGDTLQIPGRAIRVLHTPGHTSGHICLVDDAGRLLFTGDHLLPTVNPGIGLGGVSPDPIDDYLTSLGKILEFDGFEACAAHTFRFFGIAERSRVLAGHHLARTREVEAVLATDATASVWQIASRLTWTAGWDGLHEIYLASALAQTAMHAAFLRSGRAAAQFEAWEMP